MQPTDPDDRPTQPLDDGTRPLDDVWAPRPDTVDSAAPPAPSGGARRGLRVVGVAGAVLALVAAGAFGALLAGGGGDDSPALAGIGATTDEDGTDDESPDDESTDEEGTLRDRLKGRGPFGHGFGGPGTFAGGFLGRGLHGSFVVEDPDGGYQTVLTQQGTATAVSDTSLTVKSDDGFVATYRLTDETALLSGPSGTDAIAEGADVVVSAVKTGSTARAVHVVDLSQVKDRFEHHFFGDDDVPRPPEGSTPAPSGTATSGASV